MSNLEANKKLVLEFWHKVINERDLRLAPQYVVEDYVQNSPSAGQGRAEMVSFLEKELGGFDPRPADQVKYTNFAHVMAEGDLVQLMFKRKLPDPNRPGETREIWWFDCYRVNDGMIVEHWDSALE
jgi:predicted SnoaL-like aldol condensation-catalyzing enzyme